MIKTFQFPMDISNTIWDRVVNIIENNDYEGCKEEFIRIFGIEVPFTDDQFYNEKHDDLAEGAFQQVMAAFKRKTDRIQTVAMPIIQQVYENQGDRFERIMVPLTDGRKMYNIPCNLKEADDTDCKSIVKQFEKMILLHIIDESWKENLRELDELKHSVQNASYEQKDPLLIFKLESVKLFDNMVSKINNNTVAILMRGQIPEPDPSKLREAAPEQRPARNQYREEKEVLNDPDQSDAASHDTREVRREPIRSEKTVGRNDPCPCGSGKKYKNCHGSNL